MQILRPLFKKHDSIELGNWSWKLYFFPSFPSNSVAANRWTTLWDLWDGLWLQASWCGVEKLVTRDEENKAPRVLVVGWLNWLLRSLRMETRQGGEVDHEPEDRVIDGWGKVQWGLTGRSWDEKRGWTCWQEPHQNPRISENQEAKVWYWLWKQVH